MRQRPQRGERQGYPVDPAVLWRDDEIDSEPDCADHRQRKQDSAKSPLATTGVSNQADAEDPTHDDEGVES
jgi:hypothetical protein